MEDLREDLAVIQRSVAFQAKTRQSLSPEAVRAEDNAGVFNPGGHGRQFDVAKRSAQEILRV